MMTALVALGLWVVLAFLMQLFPSDDNHWRRAYVLIGLGLPLLVWITWKGGPAVGLLAFAVGALVLRWPLLYLFRWLRRLVGR